MSDYSNIIREISKAINNGRNIYISSHMNPDGDSIGSLMALGLAIEQLGKKIYFLKSDTIPNTFKFLPHIDRIKDHKDIDIDSDTDVFIILDCSNEDRIGGLIRYSKKVNTLINIDHHIDNDNFGDINLVDPSRASTGEIVFDLIEGLGLEIDVDIATYIYTAISMDSGRFLYDKVDAKTHEIAAKLIETGINKEEININLYQKRSMAATKLFIEGVSTLKTYNEDRIATVKITQDLLNKTDASMDESDGLISFIRDIDTVEVACLFKEISENEIRISVRSKSIIDVSKICNHFNGGGHKRAAGCTIYEDIETAEELILDQINRVMRS